MDDCCIFTMEEFAESVELEDFTDKDGFGFS